MKASILPYALVAITPAQRRRAENIIAFVRQASSLCQQLQHYVTVFLSYRLTGEGTPVQNGYL